MHSSFWQVHSFFAKIEQSCKKVFAMNISQHLCYTKPLIAALSYVEGHSVKAIIPAITKYFITIIVVQSTQTEFSKAVITKTSNI